MKIIRANIALITTLVLLMAFAVGAAYAQADEPIPACEGDSITGTVVAADENTGLVTFEQEDGSLCTVQFGQDFEHPITSLLGAYFDGISMDELEDHVENLKVDVVCDGDECTWADGGEDTTLVRITSVEDNGDGTWTVNFVYTDENGDTQTGSFITEDESLVEGWTESLGLVSGEFSLVTDDEGNVFFEGAGDEIEALHEDGMGFGVIVKLYAMAAEAQQACEGVDPDADPGEETFDPCEVTVESLVAEFDSGTGMGQLFQKYGRPSILGVGHVIQQVGPPNGDGGNGTPPDNACGYWRNHGDGYLPEGCEDKPGGKPPWAGTPGGPNGNGNGNNGDD